VFTGQFPSNQAVALFNQICWEIRNNYLLSAKFSPVMTGMIRHLSLNSTSEFLQGVAFHDGLSTQQELDVWVASHKH